MQQTDPQSPEIENKTGFEISPDDWLSWTEKMDDALTEDALKSVGVEISKVSGKYDKPSCDKLNAYYKDRMAEIRNRKFLGGTT